jgi:uncharacterized protein (TIGR03546 family)
MIRLVLKLIKLVMSETDPAQIGLGFALALFSGFPPLIEPHNLLVLLVVLLLRVNVTGFVAGLALWSAIGALAAPAIDGIGGLVLRAEGLKGLWTYMYNTTFWRLMGFNNTRIMGGVILSAVLFIPALFAVKALIARHRERIRQWVQKSRLFSVLKATRLFGVVMRLAG